MFPRPCAKGDDIRADRLPKKKKVTLNKNQLFMLVSNLF